ncbi:hypothetical protein SNEBB_003460 [Seison nebaliae]|nr:hypothetical protein SNEBB_003460 [Seison nebaliae]
MDEKEAKRTFTKIPVVNHTPNNLTKGVLVLMNKDGTQTVRDVYVPLTLTRKIDKLMEMNENDNAQKNRPVKGILKNRVQAKDGMSFQDIASMYFQEKDRVKTQERNLKGLPIIPGVRHQTESKKLVVTFDENQTENPNVNLIRPQLIDLSVYKEEDIAPPKVVTKDSSTQFDRTTFTSDISCQTTLTPDTSCQTILTSESKSFEFDSVSANGDFLDLTPLVPQNTTAMELINKMLNCNSNNEQKVGNLKRKRASSSSETTLPSKIVKNNHIYIKKDILEPASDLVIESITSSGKTVQNNGKMMKATNNDDSEQDAESLATIIEGLPPSPKPSKVDVIDPIISVAQPSTEKKTWKNFKPFARLGSVLKVRELFQKFRGQQKIPSQMTDEEVEELKSQFEESRSQSTTFGGISNLVQTITSKNWIECGDFLRNCLKDVTNIGELWPMFTLNKGKSELTIIYQLFSIYESKFYGQMKRFVAHYSAGKDGRLNDMSDSLKPLYTLTQMDGWKQLCNWEEQIRCYVNELCTSGTISSVNSLGPSYVPRSGDNSRT